MPHNTNPLDMQSHKFCFFRSHFVSFSFFFVASHSTLCALLKPAFFQCDGNKFFPRSFFSVYSRQLSFHFRLVVLCFFSFVSLLLVCWCNCRCCINSIKQAQKLINLIATNRNERYTTMRSTTRIRTRTNV